MLRFIPAALAASLALAGCQTLDTIDSYIKKNLPVACQSLDLAHQAFLVAHAARPFNETILQSEAAAYGNAKTQICDHPETVTSVTLVTVVFTTVVQINGYLRQAERAGVE
jgi:hypothetical protein